MLVETKSRPGQNQEPGTLLTILCDRDLMPPRCVSMKLNQKLKLEQSPLPGDEGVPRGDYDSTTLKYLPLRVLFCFVFPYLNALLCLYLLQR